MDEYKQNIECVNCQLLSLRDKERLWPCCDKPMLKNDEDNEAISLLIELTYQTTMKKLSTNEAKRILDAFIRSGN